MPWFPACPCAGTRWACTRVSRAHGTATSSPGGCALTSSLRWELGHPASWPPSQLRACPAPCWSCCCAGRAVPAAVSAWPGAPRWPRFAARLHSLPPPLPVLAAGQSVALLALTPHLSASIGTSGRCPGSPLWPRPCCSSGLAPGLALLAGSGDVPHVPAVPARPYPSPWDCATAVLCPVSLRHVPTACPVSLQHVLRPHSTPRVPVSQHGYTSGTGVPWVPGLQFGSTARVVCGDCIPGSLWLCVYPQLCQGQGGSAAPNPLGSPGQQTSWGHVSGGLRAHGRWHGAMLPPAPRPPVSQAKTEEQIAAEEAWYETDKVWLVHKDGFSLGELGSGQAMGVPGTAPLSPACPRRQPAAAGGGQRPA